MAKTTGHGKVTVKSVAEHCGVSVGTVSTVLQGRHEKRRIPMKTVERVRAAALELGYLPDIGARRLRSVSSGKTPLIIALVTSYEAPLNLVGHFLHALRGVVEGDSKISARYDISISVEMFAAGELSKMKSLVSGNSFNAAIITNTMAEDDEFLRASKLAFPAVLVDRGIEGYSSVNGPDSLGKSAAEMLLEKGRKRPAILCGSPLTQSTKKRLDSFMEVCPGVVVKISARGLSEAAGYEAMKKFFTDGGRADSLYALSDSLALGAYRAINERGLKIPQDIAVVGVGDYAYSEYFHPPLSTVGADYAVLARKACRTLMDIISGGMKAPRAANVPEKRVVRSSI